MPGRRRGPVTGRPGDGGQPRDDAGRRPRAGRCAPSVQGGDALVDVGPVDVSEYTKREAGASAPGERR